MLPSTPVELIWLISKIVNGLISCPELQDSSYASCMFTYLGMGLSPSPQSEVNPCSDLSLNSMYLFPSNFYMSLRTSNNIIGPYQISFSYFLIIWIIPLSTQLPKPVTSAHPWIFFPAPVSTWSPDSAEWSSTRHLLKFSQSILGTITFIQILYFCCIAVVAPLLPMSLVGSIHWSCCCKEKLAWSLEKLWTLSGFWIPPLWNKESWLFLLPFPISICKPLLIENYLDKPMLPASRTSGLWVVPTTLQGMLNGRYLMWPWNKWEALSLQLESHSGCQEPMVFSGKWRFCL